MKASCLACCPAKPNSARPDVFSTSLELCVLAAPAAGKERDWRWGVLGSDPDAPSATLSRHLHPEKELPHGQSLAPGGLDCLGHCRLEEGILRFEFST